MTNATGVEDADRVNLIPVADERDKRDDPGHASTSDVEAADDRPEVGSWWWVTEKSASDRYEQPSYDRPGKQWLACVVEVGSNYAKLQGVRFSERLALDDFHDKCATEPDPRAFIDGKIGAHRERVREIMGEIKALCHRLGVPVNQMLTDPEASSKALAVAHSIADVGQYGQALQVARDETLPALFKKIKAEHEQMAKWMSAELIPANAELTRVEGVKEMISGKIHTVELYAGLAEKLVQVREGAPATIDEKVHLMQRRHYMDEECLARYEAGGMDFEDVGAFDRWLSREENLDRILPHPRCVVAFRIRRKTKEYGGDALDRFIKFWDGTHEKNRKTYLYVRNGGQLWRMDTTIEFDECLFPRREDSDLLGDDEIWIKEDEYDIERDGGLITGQHRQAMARDHQAMRDWMAQKLWQWHRAGCPEKDWQYVAVEYDEKRNYSWKAGEAHGQHGRPDGLPFGNRVDKAPHLAYRLLTPSNIYHDDAMRKIADAAREHNRVAVVVQGLLDRSTCLHPHHPWKIWTPEGFAAGVELVYDVSRAVTPGPAPDFEAYRRQLNRDMRAGCHAIGQRDAWHAHMEEKHGNEWSKRGGYRDHGPGRVHRVERVRRDGSCEFRWTRDRANPIRVPMEDRPGWTHLAYPKIETGWICPASQLTCVDAYTPGDFRQFFDDPRTRADYATWAPILLACEDWHHARRKEQEEASEAKAKTKSRRATRKS